MFRATAGGLRCKVFASEVPRCKEVEGADNIKRPLRPLFLFCAVLSCVSSIHSPGEGSGGNVPPWPSRTFCC